MGQLLGVKGNKKMETSLLPGSLGKKFVDLLLFVLLGGVAASMLLPFLWLFSSSLKPSNQVFKFPIEWIPREPFWLNYKVVFTKVPFLLFYFNTLKLTVIAIASILLTCSLAAYAFSKIQFPGRNIIFMFYLSTMMVPGTLLIIPQYFIINKMGLLDTHLGLILIYLFNPFGVFLLRQSFLSIPSELSEAARIDGCSHFGIYWRVMMPLVKPSLATLALFTFVGVFNDFLAPLIYLNSQKLYTIQLGLRFFQQLRTSDFGAIMAGTFLSLVPVIIMYMFTQRFLIENAAFSGLKG